MKPYPPTHQFCGTNSDRQSVGDPGHCERCAEVGHVAAHPDLGCADVGCSRAHDEDGPIRRPVPRTIPRVDPGWGDYPDRIETPAGTLVLYGFKPRFSRLVHDDRRDRPPTGSEPVYKLLQPRQVNP